MVQVTTSSSSTLCSCFHRRRHNAATLPYRSIASVGRGQRKDRRSIVQKITFAVVVIISFIHFYHSGSFIFNDDSLNGEHNENTPLWTSCPSSTKEGENDDICFITCIFGGNVRDVDHPANIEWFDKYWCHSRFLLVTNLEKLPAPGWTRIVSEVNSTTTTVSTSSTENHIVQSRHAKFLAWDVLKGNVPKDCAVVIYMDGYLIPKRFTSWRVALWNGLTSSPWSPASPLFGWVPHIVGSYDPPQIPPPLKFQSIVKQVRNHPWGLSQVKQRYFDGLPMTTLLSNLVRDRKDTKEHVEKTLEWFRSQTTDFEEIIPYYLNKYFGE